MENKPKPTEKVRNMVDPLRDLFHKMNERIMSKQDAMKMDITKKFIQYLMYKIRKKEIIRISITGESAKGKSTDAMAIQKKVHEYIVKYGKNKWEDIDPYLNICGDQIEFNRYIRKRKENQCVIIDEYSRFGEGGANATTESQVFDSFIDMFAQKNIHLLTCSPKERFDTNCFVILEVEGKDLDKKVNTCSLYYQNITDGKRRLLGHIKIDVSEIVGSDLEKRYRRKKWKRFELLDKVGVRDIRPLEMSEYAYLAYQDLEPLARLGRVGDTAIIPTVEEILQDNQHQSSFFNSNEIAGKVRSLMSLKRSIEEIKGSIATSKEGIIKRKTTTGYIALTEEEARKEMEKLEVKLKKSLDRCKLHIKTKKEYLATEG